MLIKPVDDRSKRLKFLLNLQDSPLLDAEQRKWLDDELWTIRRNFMGEETSANYIDECFGESEEYAVLHDVRLRTNGTSIHIDHLVLARECAFLIETRAFSGNIVIDENGDFTIDFSNGATESISAPMKRGQRHEKLLQDFFEAQGIKTRNGPLPAHHVALLPDESRIRRPPAAKLDTSNVIHARSLITWVQEKCARHEAGLLSALSLGLRRSPGREALREWGEKIAAEHHQENPFFLPKFMRLKSRGVPRRAHAVPSAPVPLQATPEPTPSPAPQHSPAAEAAIPYTDEEQAVPTLSPAHSDSFEEAEAHTEFLGTHPDEMEEAHTEFLGTHPDEMEEAHTEFLDHEAHDEEVATEALMYHEDEESTESLEHSDDEAETEFLGHLPESVESQQEGVQPPAGGDEVDVCATCGRPLAAGMAQFCREHSERFGGKLYCFMHQDDFPSQPGRL